MIAILDYGSGNLRSAERAFATTGEEVVVTSDSRTCVEARGLVVPGVGAFRSCMTGLKKVQGDEIIRKRLEDQRATFGICIGMQIFFESGSEPSQGHSGSTNGLGVWPGNVSKLVAPVLPHMGWNSVKVPSGSTLFAGVEEQLFYFVHSYAAKDEGKNIHGAMTSWGEYGEKFVAAREDGAFCATQFHPEKSGSAGLALIKNWTKSL